MNNVPQTYDVFLLDDAKLVPCPENQLYHYSQNIYPGSYPLEVEENSLILTTDDSDKKLLIVEPEHLQCPHGVSIIETESSHLIRKAAVLQNVCYFLGEDNHLYQFNLTRGTEADVFQTEKVFSLKNRVIRDIRGGRNHMMALVEQYNSSSSHMDDRLITIRNSYATSNCRRCREEQELRLSILQLEADRKASETELLLDSDELESLRNSMYMCLKDRTISSNRSSDVCARPSSLSSLPDVSHNTRARERTFSSIYNSENSFSFLSMDTLLLEAKRQEYEKQESVEDTLPLFDLEKSTDSIQFSPPLEIWVWGDNDKGQLGLSKLENRAEPSLLQSMSDRTITEISCGNHHSAAVTATGELFIWGSLEATELWKNQTMRIAPLKLGPEQFVFRSESTGDSTFFLVIGRESKVSLYSWCNGSVRRISQVAKDQFLVNIYVREGNINVVQSSGPFMKEKLAFVFKTFQQIRLIKGLSDICNAYNNLFNREFDIGSMPEKEREVLVKVAQSAKKLYDAVCSIQGEILEQMHNAESPVVMLSIFGNEIFSVCFDDFVLRFCVDDAYRTTFPELPEELKNSANRLALEFNVDSNGFASQLRNLVLEALAFFNFLSFHASEHLQTTQSEGEKDTLSALLKTWRRKTVLLQRMVTSTRKTKNEAWINLKLAHMRVPGRFLIDVFRVGEGQKIKQMTVEQSRFYLHKVLAIYIFHDLFVADEIRSYKSCVKCCPLSLVWLERVDDHHLTVITPDAQYTLEFTADSNWFSLCCGSWSDILMEGNPVPATRQGQFEFSGDCSREHLRLKSYTGSWRMGKLSGRGKLVNTKNGDTEDGIFQDDYLHGFGQRFIDSPFPESQSTFYTSTEDPEILNKDFYRGIYEKGELHGLAHIRYSNNFCYDGFTKCGIPNGFGVMTYANEAMLGNFENGFLTGYGVICTNKDNRLGKFQEGKLHGRGIMINLDGNICEGEWEHDKMKRGRILTSTHDGSFPLEYEGETDLGDSNFDIGKQGKLRVSKDMLLEGSFTGNILKREIKIVEASICPKVDVASPVTSMLSGNGPDPSTWAVPLHDRWKVLFETFTKENIGLDSGSEEIELVRNIWSKIVRSMTHGKLLMHGNVSTGFCDALERIPQYDDYWSWHYYKMAAEYWRLAQDNEYHPLRRLMNGVVEVFTASYSGISAHAIMYSYCVLETKYLIDEVYHIFRMLFPNFPESPYAKINKESHEHPVVLPISSPESSPGKAPLKKNIIPVPQPCSDFIAETFFARCSPILFTIYSLHNVERDERYWSRAMYLNAHTDVKLLTHLEVDQELWPIAISSTTTRDLDRPIIVTTARDKFYRKAVDSLQRLPSETNPSTKLRLLAETYTVMEQCIAEQTEIGSRHVFTADSLLQAFIYVVIRAQIRHLGSEILFLDDFSREWRGEGAIGLLFTNLQSAYMYICNEKSLV